MAHEISSNDRTIIIITIIVYILLISGIGLFFSKKVKSVSDLTIGGRKAGAWMSALSYGAAYFSAVMFIGYAGATGWNFGLWGVLAGIGNAVFGSYLAWKVLAVRTRNVSQRLKIQSMPQFFELRYNSASLRVFSAIIMFVFLIPYSASVYKGLASICKVILGVSELPCMIIIAGVSALLLFLGGYLAQVRADFVQGLVMMVSIVFMIFFIIRSKSISETGNLFDGFAAIGNFAKGDGLRSLSFNKWVTLMATVLMTSFGTWGLPHMIQKYYGIKDDKEAKKGVVISAFFSLIVAGGGYFVGSLSRMFFSELPDGGQDFLIPNMLRMAELPAVLLGIILVLLVAASVTTLSSIALTASSIVSMDLIKFKLKKNMDDTTLKRLIKMFCLIFVISSFIVANTKTPILDMMSYSWGIISGSFLAPFVLALYSKKINKIGAWASVLSGFIIALIPAVSKFILIAMGNPEITDSGAVATLTSLSGKGPLYACIAMIVSLIVCYLVSIAASKNHEINYKFYEKEKQTQL
ncbi:MAG TPA: sodium:solute symporter family protein [Oscillospiraceae bacterium]|nr:sodium:solute symporter family protein [Oscillospiraceae bacterium]